MNAHNPDSLSDEQVGVADGWRLLECDEIGDPFLGCVDVLIEGWRRDIEWNGYGTLNGCLDDTPYRTKLTRAELRVARGLPPESRQSVADQPTHGLTPAEVAVGAVDGHPEDFCGKCRRSNPVWFAPNDVWNKVTENGCGILCPSCFAEMATSIGITDAWMFAPETSMVQPPAAAAPRPWKVPPMNRICCLCGGPAAESDPRICADAFCGANTVLDWGYTNFTNHIPKFSTDLNAAMGLVDGLRKEGWSVTIDGSSDGWALTFARGDVCFIEGDESLPLAICEAFLKARKEGE